MQSRHIDHIPEAEVSHDPRHEHPSYREPQPYQRRPSKAGLYALVILSTVAIAGGSFAAGVGVGHGFGTANAAGTSGFGGTEGRGAFRRMNGGFGTVTAVTSDSITISESAPGGSSSSATTKTYSISSSTTVTNNGASAAVSDIKTGDTVMIRTSSSSSNEATEIRINPSQAAPGASTDSTTPSDSSDSTDTTTNT